jgi:ferric iron reductase protein FhuF
MSPRAAASPSLEALQELVRFLGARRGEPERGDLLAADLIEDPDRLAEVIRDTVEARGSYDLQVVASLWWQGYSYRVAGVTLAAWVLTGTAPDPSAAVGTGVGVARGRPSSLLVGSDAEDVGDLDTLVDRLFPGHLDLLAASLRARHTIGERLLWGNTAASVASCLGALAGADGAPDLADRIERATVALPHDLARLGTWTTPHTEYHRSTCCLWWKTTVADGALCEDCSLR